MPDYLKLALELAHNAHAHQVDKAGKPYIEHPLRVMQNMETLTEKIVALLHDAVEDSDLTIEDLIQMGFPDDAITAIAAISKQEGEDYAKYLARVSANPIALKVKIADMTDNMNWERLPHPTPADRERMKKYELTLPTLKAALANGQ